MSYHRKGALQANLEAVRTLLALEKTHRAPSEAEAATLRKYNGFGGLSCVLFPVGERNDYKKWPRDELDLFPLVHELREIIFQETSESDAAQLWNSLKSSVLTSFYTDERIVRTITAGLGGSTSGPSAACSIRRREWASFPARWRANKRRSSRSKTTS